MFVFVLIGFLSILLWVGVGFKICVWLSMFKCCCGFNLIMGVVIVVMLLLIV